MARRKIDLDRLPSNNQTTSNRNKIVEGGVRTQARGGIANKIRDIGNSLFESIVVPAMKDNVINFFNEGIEMLIKGERTTTRPRRGRHTSYHRMGAHERRNASRRRSSPRRRPQEHEEIFEDVYFDERADAELVLGRMMERIVDYELATIGDLYTMVGITSYITHERWGWRDLRHCRVIYTTEGYIIDFPDPEHLK